MSDPLLDYSRALLDLVDGAVDLREDGVLDVLLPEAVGDVLGLPAEATLAFGSQVPRGATKVGLESDWLARSGRLLADRGARLEVVLPPREPLRIDPEVQLESRLELPNATWRLRGVRPALTRYVFLTARYSAISDDRRDGILTVGLNVATGAWLGEDFDPLRLAAERALRSSGHHPGSTRPDAPPAPDAAALQDILQIAVGPRARRALRPFVAGLERRLARDAERLVGYHQRLLQELRDAHQRDLERASRDRGSTGAAGPDPRARAEAITREFRARMEDLGQKFALEIEVTPIRVLDVLCPVQRIDVDILRRKKRRRIAMDYCDEARRLEPLRCEDRWTEARRRLACDAEVHLISEAGLLPCESCACTVCRVCHPRACPRCKVRWPAR